MFSINAAVLDKAGSLFSRSYCNYKFRNYHDPLWLAETNETDIKLDIGAITIYVITHP